MSNSMEFAFPPARPGERMEGPDPAPAGPPAFAVTCAGAAVTVVLVTVTRGIPDAVSPAGGSRLRPRAPPPHLALSNVTGAVTPRGDVSHVTSESPGPGPGLPSPLPVT